MEITTNGRGYITGIKMGDLGMTAPEPVVPKETIAAVGGVPVKQEGMMVKFITATEPQIFEDEINAFNGKHKVKFTQTMVWGNYLVATLFYE